MNTSSPVANGDSLPHVDPSLIYTAPEEYHRQMEARTRALIAAARDEASNSISAPIGSMAKTVAMNHRPDIWKRYGPEIETTMASLPASSRADVDTWKRVVNYVASEHLDELVEARAREVASTRGDTGMLPSDGSPPSPNGNSLSPVRQLFRDRPDIKERYAEADLDAASVIAHYAKMGHDEKKAAEIISRKYAR